MRGVTPALRGNCLRRATRYYLDFDLGLDLDLGFSLGLDLGLLLGLDLAAGSISTNR